MSTLNRRSFIRKSGGTLVAGAALGAPAILSSQSPNERMRVGFFGTGSRGCDLMRSIVEAGMEVDITDVCDIYPPNLEAGVRETGGKARAHAGYHELLEEKGLDIVFVATPLVNHVSMCLDALQAGKHIYCEKSMGYSVAECDRLVAAVKASDRIVQIGYSPHDRQQQKVRELIASGAIGQVTQVFSHYHRNSTWIVEGIEPEWWRALNWRLYWEYCGGLMTELVSHQLTAINWILDAHPLSAVGQGGVDLYKDHGRETWDNVNVVYEYPNGVKLNATSLLFNARHGRSITILGTHGTIEMAREPKIFWEKETRHLGSYGVDATHFKIKLGQSLNEDESPDGSPGKIIEVEPEEGPGRRGYGFMLPEFFACVREGGVPAIDVIEGRRSSITSLMANRVISEGRRVTWEEMESLG